MDEEIRLFEDIAIRKDYLGAIRLLLNYPLINWVSQYFSRMRDAKGLLRFVSFCRGVMEGDHNKLAEGEWEDYDQKLIGYELFVYERLNEFEKYIRLFDDVRANKSYIVTYKKSRDDPRALDHIKSSYILGEDYFFKYVHFLYLTDHRYQIILRKKARQDAGKLPKTMLRHQQADLSVEELNDRNEQLRHLMDRMMLQFFGYKEGDRNSRL